MRGPVTGPGTPDAANLVPLSEPLVRRLIAARLEEIAERWRDTGQRRNAPATTPSPCTG